ncbi:MAG TPA: hypothetical protein VK509_19455 [Polyangiales bacterium]|nr:hypothetical protein [Polyangiales bacterium]
MKRTSLVFALACGLYACDGSDDAGAGSLKVSASGEQAALSGYPVGEGDDEIAFADGWTMVLGKVLISIGDFRLRTQDGDDAMVDSDPVVFDLHQGEPKLWSFDDVPAQRWDRVGYKYELPTSKTRTAGDVANEDLEQMIDEGYSLLVAGTARKDGREIEFEYGFPFEITMDNCHNGIDDTDGLVIGDGAAAEAQITIHLDHLFFDDWAIEDPALRFDAMAEMAPAGGVLTLDDLAAQDNLSDLLDAAGAPLELGYDPGSEFEPVPENLRDLVISAATTTGHFNGEGHCDYERTK